MENKRWALIIGASHGIGRGVAITLAKLGYHCLLVARSHEKLVEVKSKCDHYQKSFVLTADINDDLSRLVSEIEKITTEINFVWLGASFIKLDIVEDLKPAEIEKIVRTGYESHLKLINGIYPLLKAGKAQVLTACSDELWGEEYNFYGPSVYQSVKMALASFGKLFQKEAVHDGIRVTNLKLGDTGSFAGFQLEDHQQQIDEHQNKMLTVKQVCHVVEFIAGLPQAIITDLTIIPSDPNY
jgi:NADP-dependent 3-hydroxy acid dehydrogenase YdfG